MGNSLFPITTITLSDFVLQQLVNIFAIIANIRQIINNFITICHHQYKTKSIFHTQ
jgi:hypothetical protein